MKAQMMLLASGLTLMGCLDGASAPSLGRQEQASTPDCGEGELLTCEENGGGEIYCWCASTSEGGGKTDIGGPDNWIEIIALGLPDPDVTYYDCYPAPRAGTVCSDGQVSFDMRDLVLEACVEDAGSGKLSCQVSPATSPRLPREVTAGLTVGVIECPAATRLACEAVGRDARVCGCVAE